MKKNNKIETLNKCKDELMLISLRDKMTDKDYDQANYVTDSFLDDEQLGDGKLISLNGIMPEEKILKLNSMLEQIM